MANIFNDKTPMPEREEQYDYRDMPVLAAKLTRFVVDQEPVKVAQSQREVRANMAPGVDRFDDRQDRSVVHAERPRRGHAM